MKSVVVVEDGMQEVQEEQELELVVGGPRVEQEKEQENEEENEEEKEKEGELGEVPESMIMEELKKTEGLLRLNGVDIPDDIEIELLLDNGLEILPELGNINLNSSVHM